MEGCSEDVGKGGVDLLKRIVSGRCPVWVWELDGDDLERRGTCSFVSADFACVYGGDKARDTYSSCPTLQFENCV